MKKRIIFSFSLTVVMAAAIAVGAAAVFIQTNSVSGHTVSNAIVDLSIEGLSSGEINKPLSASGLVPGQWTGWARAELVNGSTSPTVKLYMYVDNLSGDSCTMTNLNVTTGNAGSDASERARDVYNGPILDIAGGAKRIVVTGVPPSNTLAPDTTQVIQQRAQLDESADNFFQGKFCSWDEFFVAESVEPTP